MDLHSMLNSGPAPEKKSSYTSPAAPRTGLAPAAQADAIGANGRPSLLNSLSSTDGATNAWGKSSTPLQTPVRTPGELPYSFPGQQQQPYPPAHSPARSLSGQHYPPSSQYPSTTPGQRPASYGYQYPQPSPSQPQPSGFPQAPHLHHSTSHSPTPSSHHSQTPHSLRQSPLPVLSGHPSSHHLQHSQPSTPLGPPPLHYHRTANYGQQELQSPYHSRTLSGASSGFHSGSPAQHHPSIGNLVDSPSAYSRPSPQLRRTSDYLSHIERERSVSVSPKTRIAPRPPSLGSRHSSQQDVRSARNSTQSGIPIDSHGHMASRSVSYQSAPQSSASHSIGEIAPQSSSLAQLSYLTTSSAPRSSPGQESQAHATENAVQHQTQKMDMNHLLSATPDILPTANGSAIAEPRSKRKEQPDVFVKPSPRPKKPTIFAPPPPPPLESREATTDIAVLQPDLPQSQSASFVLGADSEGSLVSEAPKTVLKRHAEHDPLVEPLSKRSKRHKYYERPIWARLAPTNPRYHEQHNGVQAARADQQSRAIHGQVPHLSATQRNGSLSVPPQGPGHISVDGRVPERPPWLHNPPLDHDLIHARQVLGAWEKTITWNTPYPDLLKNLQDWLYQQLAALGDVGNDPSAGTIEIEAKIGHIMQKGSDDRIQAPVETMTVLAPAYCEKLARFESQMDLHAHKAMNAFLNARAQDSMQKGRIKMHYEHPHETDSFRTLSAAGYQALPPAFQRRPLGRDLKLRTTTDQKGAIKARIVKIPVANKHIYNPNDEYDCRISINLEVNLMRPDLNPTDLIEEPTGEKPAPPDRRKDRLSYKHLAYSIDLTKVEVSNAIAPKFELELEVDAGVLREQMRLLQAGEPHAYGDVVCGFLDNAIFLMRQRPAAG